MKYTLVIIVVLSLASFLEGASLSSQGHSVDQSLNDCTCIALSQRTWTTPENVYLEDGQVATSQLGAGQFSTRLQILFDFGEIPDGSTIGGVEVSWRRYGSQGNCRDLSMQLIVGNVSLASDYCVRVGCNTDWDTTIRTDTFGSDTDLWGLQLTADQVKGSFGIALRTTRNGGGGGTRNFMVDSVNMTVYYTSPEEQKAADAAAAKKNAGTIAAAVVVPIVCIGCAVAGVLVYFQIKKKRPEIIEGVKKRVQSTIEDFGKPEANIDVEKVPEESSDKHYSKDATTRIGLEESKSDTKGPLSTSTSPKRPSRPSSVVQPIAPMNNQPYKPAPTNGGSVYVPTPTNSQPYKPAPTNGGSVYIPTPTNNQPYKPTPTNGSVYIPSPTNRDSSFMATNDPRGSAFGSSILSTSSLGSELPIVGKYQKSGKNAFSQTLVFGAPIDIVRTTNGVPVAVEETISYLERKGYQEEGILRLAGGTQDIKAIKETYDKGQTPDFSKAYDSHSISGALKLYFRDLPQRPLLMTKGIKQASTATDQPDFVEIMQKEFENIPEVNYFTLKRLFQFLNLVSSASNINRMTADNLAIVFQPTLQLPKPLIIALINHPEIFAK